MDGNVHSRFPRRPSFQRQKPLYYRHKHLVVRRVLRPCLPLDAWCRFWHPEGNHRRYSIPVVLPPPDRPGTYVTRSHKCRLRSRNHNLLRHYLLLHSSRPPYSPPLPHPSPTRPCPRRNMLLHCPTLLNRHTHKPFNPHLCSHSLPTSYHFVSSPCSTLIRYPKRRPLHSLPRPQYAIPNAPPLLHSFAPPLTRNPLHHSSSARLRWLGYYRSLSNTQNSRRSHWWCCEGESVRLCRGVASCCHWMGGAGCY